jgi:ketosteroid isomerase-like protein
MKRWAMALALLAVTADASAAPAPGEQAIIDHGKQWSLLYEAGRIDEMRPLYEPDAWLMTNGAPVAKGVDAILAFLRRNKASGNRVSFAVSPELITIEGRHGYLISKYWMSITKADGAKIDAAGRSFLVFKRGRDRKWRIWRDIDNQSPDVTAADRPKG